MLSGLFHLLILRDPGHCIDLGCKDACSDNFLQPIIRLAKIGVKFLRVDKVRGIKAVMVEQGRLTGDATRQAQLFADTRFYGAVDMLTSLIENFETANALPAEEGWKEYVASRPTLEKKRLLETKLNLFCTTNKALFIKARDVLFPFKYANKLTSSQSTPLAAYPAIVWALKNDINTQIHRTDNGGDFNTVITSASNINFDNLVGDEEEAKEEEEEPSAAVVHANQEAAAAEQQQQQQQQQQEQPEEQQHEPECKFKLLFVHVHMYLI